MIYRTIGTCAREIHIEIQNDILQDVKFIGGCMGNGTGISRLVKGMKVEDVIEILKGVDCGGRGTSCPDQLAKALSDYMEDSKK